MPSRTALRSAAAGIVLWAALLSSGASSQSAVRVWSGTLALPTYEEGAANPNPPFDLFSFGRFNYPYPIRDALTGERTTVNWRSLNLENEYLRLTVLPDLGGHVYSCLDKRTGREMFYANPAIKKALIGYRGAWAALGIEFNFPVSHNWMSVSPVDFATARNSDGSGSIWIGNVDQVFGSQWRVELRLSPGRSALEQKVELYNAGNARHRYYWWTNAAVQVWDDSRLVYPTELMATHGFTRVEPWPVDARGRNMSVIRNQTDGPVSLFTYLTREAFVGVYHPHTGSGTVNVAELSELPFHKVWSWGADREAEAWRDALSDDHSAYVELQTGLFRNQETYAFLEPQESVRFSETWLPVRDLGGITRANADAVLNMDRPSGDRIRLALDVTRDLQNARIRIQQGSKVLADSTSALSPRVVWRTELNGIGADPVRFELTDEGGRTVLLHTEGVFDRTPASAARLGPTGARAAAPAAPSEASIVERGTIDELEGRRLQAMSKYTEGLKQRARDLKVGPAELPGALSLLRAAGRLGVSLGWTEAGKAAPASPIDWLEAAHARNTTDFEVEYYLGLALAAAGRDRDARPHFEAARRFRATRAQATLQLARMSAREGDAGTALVLARAMAEDAPRAWRAGAVELASLRRLGRKDEASQRVRYWRTIEPTSSLFRYEETLSGASDQELWAHLGADANRVLDLVDEYLALGAYEDALGLLAHEYPAVESPSREPGAVGPAESPLVTYYRGYVRAKAGGSGDADYAQARTLPIAYVFPNRRSSYAVLEAALQANPEDERARFLLASLYLAAGLVQPAVDAWQHARNARPALPTLHRNLGLALLYGPGNFREARAVLEEGAAADRSNVDVFLALDGALSAENATAGERVAALQRFGQSEARAPSAEPRAPSPDPRAPSAERRAPSPDPRAPSAEPRGPSDMPAPLVFKLAMALAEAGEAGAAERLFHDRFFPREEGGTSVKSVYAEVRLKSAEAAARAGQCAEARTILDTLEQERKDLQFTAGGLASVLGFAPMALQAASIEMACGRQSAARSTLTRLAHPGGGANAPIAIAIASLARKRLAEPASAAERQELNAALEAATATMESGTSGNPGLTEYTRALLLSALGRPEESRQAWRRVFVYPDRSLSHALARSASEIAAR